MKQWLVTKAFEIFILWGNKVLGYDTITLHLTKDKDMVIGISFGEWEKRYEPQKKKN